MTEFELFAAALEVIDSAERKALLARVCGDDGAMRERVERLLQRHESNSGFMIEPSAMAPQAMPPTIMFNPPGAATSPSGAIEVQQRQLAKDDPPEPEPSLGTEDLGHSAFIPQQNPPMLGLGNFEIDRTIGKGGMGIVLKARDKKLKRNVAIKVLAPHLAADAEAVQRFLREAQSAAAVRHDNVVTIHAVDEANGVPYLVMELINGESLQDRIKRGPLPVDEIVQFGIQIASGLDAAHRRGLIHRDIKPANILLESQNEPGEPNVVRVKITDFGLARVMSESAITRSGFIAGTPQYMSPEQANGKPLDHRSDLFSLGSVLYSLCTGQAAFHAESAIAVLRRVTDHEPEPIRSLNPAIPDWLCEVIAKFMAKQPEDRIQTAKEVADLLTRCQAPGRERRDGPTTAHTLPIGQSVPPEASSLENSLTTARLLASSIASQGSSRGPMTATLNRTLIAVALLAVIVLAVVFSRGRDPRPTALDLTATNSSVGFRASRSASASGSSGAESVGANDVRGLTHPGSQEAALPTKKLHLFLDDSYEWTPPVELGPGINGAGSVDHASISSDGLLMVMSRIENRRSQLWWSVRESERDPFPAATPLPPEVNSDVSNQTPFLSRDGLSLWFASNRSGGAGHSDLYVSRRKSLNDSFERPVSLGPTINSPGDETSPFVTADELTLLFAAGIPRQIFQAKRKSKKDSFVAPQRLALINGASWQEFPRLSQDGLTLVLVVSRSPGGEQRLEVASRSTVDADFDKPVDLGPVNRGVMSGLSLSGDETTVYFSTSQTPRGARGLWMSRRVKKPSQAKPAESAKSGSSPPPAVVPFDATQARQHQEAWAKHLDLPVEYENSIGMKFRLVPPGEFLMGSTPEEIEATLKVADSRWQEHIESEGPQHKVILTKPIYVGATEVTQVQYEQVMENNPSHFSATGKGNGQVANLETGDHPVEMASWYDAAEFCAKLSQQEKLKPFYSRSDESVTLLEGTGYRLPTEAEWEFACRSGTTTRFWNGDDDQNLISAGWFSGNAGSRTHDSTESKANPFGLSDMHGNVWEWTQDGWDPAFYSQFQKNAALDPSSPFLGGQNPRPIRGGDWHSHPFECRSAQRLKTWPNWQRDNMGFRVVLVADAVKELLGKPGANAPPPAVTPFD